MGVPTGSLRTAAYWRERAEEALNVAEQMRDVATRAIVLDIAAKYDEMAQRAEAREAKLRPN